MRARTPNLESTGRALVESLERIHERDRLRARIDAAREALHVHMRTVCESRAALRRDVADVESLERPGLRHLVAALTGGATRRLSGARRELAEAKHRLDEAKALADADQAEIRELAARIDAMGDVDHAELVAFAAKEEALAQTSPRAREALRRVAAAIGDARAGVAAVNDAWEAARAARQSVRNVVAELKAARSSGRNVLEAQSHYDDARAFARQANARLARLARCLVHAPGIARTQPPAYTGEGWTVDGSLSADTKRIDVWLARVLGRVHDRRKALKARAETLEARRDRWVLRA